MFTAKPIMISAILPFAVFGALATQPIASSPELTTAPTSSLVTEARLDDKTIDALKLALEDERRAAGLYAAVMDRFGKRKPFSNIIRAEYRHAAALISIMKRYGVDIPSNPWEDFEFEVPNTYREACQAAVQAEIENIALYDKFLKYIKPSDVRKVMQNLRAASKDRHLPAFRRCSSRR